MQGTSNKALRVILILFSIWMALPRLLSNRDL